MGMLSVLCAAVKFLLKHWSCQAFLHSKDLLISLSLLEVSLYNLLQQLITWIISINQQATTKNCIKWCLLFNFYRASFSTCTQWPPSSFPFSKTWRIKWGIKGEKASVQCRSVTMQRGKTAKFTAVWSQSPLRTPYTSCLYPLYVPHSVCSALNPYCTHQHCTALALQLLAPRPSFASHRSVHWPPQIYWKPPTQWALFLFLFSIRSIHSFRGTKQENNAESWVKTENREGKVW